MPFIKGAELHKVFKKKKTFDEELVKFYAVQIIIAVGHLHEQNVVHRDLKMENILLDGDGYIKVIDYGLAKEIEVDEYTRTQCGTPMYMAPEVLENSGHNKDVDWWALGVLLFEMLFGISPFWDKRITIMQKKIKEGKVLFPDPVKYDKVKYSEEIRDLIT